ncbi:hypothetical protein ABZ883_02485 [Streptomyces sp. NPDC046977]|uniref:hypothetical protein n=1 Tax=Streptomyces sp. NPDC046977 TaxID=3154703 RepID=UPI0033EABF40
MTVRQQVLGLATTAGVLVVAAVVGSWSGRPGGLLVMARVLHHPVLFGLLALAALAAAVLVGARNLLFRVLVLAAAVLIALPALLFAGSEREVTTNEAAPHRSDRHLVVEEGTGVVDPLWWVYVEEGSGLTKRRWPIGYFNGDAAHNALTEASWDGLDGVRLVTGEEDESQVYFVDLAPEGGKPCVRSRGVRDRSAHGGRADVSAVGARSTTSTRGFMRSARGHLAHGDQGSPGNKEAPGCSPGAFCWSG